MNFVKRNAPIFIIGTITLLVFVGIIIAGQKTTNAPILEKVDEAELISEHTYTTGNQEAKITLVEFSDFQCPACGSAEPFVSAVVEKFKDDLKFAYRHFPLPQHKFARKAAEAAQIAGEDGAFWEYHAILFRNQNKLDKDSLIIYAKDLGLDEEKFKARLDGGSFASVINDDIKTGEKLGVNSTPTFFLNGVKLEIASFIELETKVAEEINKLKKAEGKESDTSVKDDETEESTKTPLYIDQKYGIVEISYTEKTGFVPDDITVYSGQLVRWLNKSASPITIVEAISKFPEFKGGVTIEPGKSYEYRLVGNRLWTYKIKDTNVGGTIFINDKF